MTTNRPSAGNVKTQRNWLSELNRLIPVVILVSALLCAGLAWLYVEHRSAIKSATAVVDEIHWARVELGKGFLHLSQDGGPGSPFDRGKGLVLLRQSLSSFEKAMRDLGLFGTGQWEEFRARIRSFQTRLTEMSHPGAGERMKRERIRIAFGELEEQADRLNDLAEARLREKADQLYWEFIVALVLTTLLLAVLAVVLVRAGRASRNYEAALGASERFATDVIDSLTSNLAVLDRDGVVISVNEAWRRFARENDAPDAGAYVGSNYLKVCEEAACRDGDDLAATALAGIRHVLEGTDTSFELEYPCHSPEVERWFLMHVSPQCGGESGGVIAHENITARKRAEAERDRFNVQRQLALDAARLGWWSYDPVTKIASYDRRYQEIFAVTGHERPNDEILARIHPEDLPGVWAAVEAALNPSDPQPYLASYRVIVPGTPIRWVEAHGMAVFAGDGPARRATGFVGTVEDITERKAEEARRDAQTGFSRILADNPNLDAAAPAIIRTMVENLGWAYGEIWFPDADDGRIRQQASWHIGGDALEEFARISRGKRFAPGRGLSGKAFSEGRILWVEDVTEDPEFLRRDEARRAGLHTAVTVPIREGEETTGVFLLFCFLVRPSDNALLGFLEDAGGRIGNFVARKKTEAALQESERKYRLITDNMADTITVLDLTFKRIYVSPSIVRLRGYTVEEAMEQSLRDILTPASYETAEQILMEEIAREVEGGGDPHRTRTAELEQICKDGSLIWTEMTMSFVRDESGTPVSILVSSRNITDRKRAEEAMRKSEEQYRELFENAQEGIFQASLEGRFLSVNPALACIYGYDSAQELVESITDIGRQLYVNQGDREKILRLMIEKGFISSYEVQHRRKDGSTVWLSLSSRPVCDEKGNVVKLEGMAIDITERKWAEEALLESRTKLQAALANMTDAVFISDSEGRFIEFNDAFATFHKFRSKGDCARTLAEYPEFLDVFMADGTVAPLDQWAVSRALRGEIGTNVEYGLRRKDTGEAWTGSYSFAPIRDEKGAIVGSVVVGRDITEEKKAAEALRSSEARYRRIISTAKEGIAMTDADDRISYVNPSMQEMTGYEEQELVGRHVLELVFPEDVPDHRKRMERRHDRAADVYERRFRRKDGGELWTIVSAAPVLDDQNRFQGSFAMFTDITQRKETEKELEEERQSLERRVTERTAELARINAELADLYNSAPCGYHSLDADGLIVRINDTELEWLGYSREEVVDKLKITDLFTPASMEEFRKSYPVFQRQGYINDLEFDLVRKDGTILPVLVSATAIRDDAGRFVMSRSTVIDYTNQKKAAAELRQANIELTRASRLKEEFLSTMSHEIRTPLNAIVMLNRLLSDTSLTLKQQQLARKMDLSSRNLLGLISDILDFSKIEAGRIDLESIPFSLDDVLDNLSSLASTKAQEKDLEMLFLVEDDVPYQLVGDPVRLGQVLHNLIGNAVKFTNSGEIVVSVSCMKGEDSRVELIFHVHDTGIGMSREELERIFRPFTQADASTTRRFGGTGLGLAISKSLVDLMGGTLKATSEPGAGSTFTFTSVFGLQDHQLRKKHTLPESLRGLRVLVADDKEPLRRFFASALEGFSCRVTTVKTGTDAVKEVARALQAEEPYGLVLLDYGMPEMDGMEATRRIRSLRGLSETPILLMAMESAENTELQKAVDRKIVNLLMKPVSRSSLFDAVMTALGAKQVSEARRNRGAAVRLQDVRVLLVEDNEINQEVEKVLLESRGIDVSIASNGKEAVEMFLHSEETPYDLILMDIRMPVMDGYQATEEIRRLDPAKTVPIIAMTAEAIAGTAESVYRVGMNDYITKPIDPERLFEKLAFWLKLSDVDRLPGSDRAEGGSEFELPEFSCIDVPAGLAHVSGNRVLFRKLLLKFRTDHGDFAETLQREVEADDTHSLLFSLHGMKGVAGNIGAQPLAALVAELENEIRMGRPDLERYRGLVGSVEAAFRDLVAELDAFRTAVGTEAPAGGPAEKFTREERTDALTAMAAYLESYDARAADHLSQVKRMFTEPVFRETLQELEGSIVRYDYDRAAVALQKLKKRLDEPVG